ncbi:hypothetical protein GH5_01599 [Leishmania sp. Ghana 2012 LV757]|uniref:hypothetical protein n=1 Tax=Leishmania sp. Ghana 2012 LV757 TaxID=2803181 RepID=UPI001B67D676|nr:hypothetical protein GH5_01599 [Leishmania sp. Ghana 2012 LV757]
MIIIPVEKKGKYAKHVSLRFFCFDPTTRMAYMSDKRTKKLQWKHSMRVYAVIPSCVNAYPEVDYRHPEFEARDLLIVTVYGVPGSRLDSDDPETQAELQRLPKLFSENTTEGDSANSSVMGGQDVISVSEQSVSTIDEARFFGKEQESWILRCFYYRSMENVVSVMVEALVADGLRYPVNSGLRNWRDPRNGLRLTSIPLYLQAAFSRLLGSVIYTCLHGVVCGLSGRGRVRIMVPHVYLCITDRELLFVAENGAVVRLLPLTSLDAIEYSGPSVNGTATTSSRNPCTSSFLSPYIPFASFLTTGNPADVLFALSNPFMDENGDCSASMASVMPQVNAGKDMGVILHVLRTFSNPAWNSNRPKTNPNGSGARRDEVSGRSPDFDTSASTNIGVSTAGDNSSLVPCSFKFVTLPFEQSLEDYIDVFQQNHGRQFKWTTLSGGQELVPNGNSTAAVAQSCGMRPPARHSITNRPDFLHFYYGSESLAKAYVEATGEEKSA